MVSPGTQLKKIRLEKGISLEEVQKKTKIHLNILKAIEGDSLTHLSPVYLKGFLKIYCHFLGVDPHDYIAGPKEPQVPVVKITASRQEPQDTKQAVSFLKAFSQKIIPLKVHVRKLKAAFIAVIIVIFVVVIFFNIGKFISSKRRAYSMRKKSVAVSVSRPVSRSKTVEKKEIPVVPIVKAAPKSNLAPSAPAVVVVPSASKALQKEAGSGIKLGVRTKENCWILVKVDGRVVFQRTLEKGRFENWQAKDKIELSVGNAGVVELEVNGQLFSNLGRKGQALKNIVITKDGLDISR